MTTKKTFETSTVRELAKHFDTVIPGWYRFITKPLNMLDSTACILGQYGHHHDSTYSEMRRKLFPNYCPCTSPNAKKNAYRSLLSDSVFNTDWQREVDKRKATDTVKMPVAESGTFEWAMQQLMDGKTVMHDKNILIPATDGKVPAGFKFTYDEVISKNWKLKPLMLRDLNKGDKFKFVDKHHGRQFVISFDLRYSRYLYTDLASYNTINNVSLSDEVERVQ